MTSWLQAEVERLGDTQPPRALALFDVLDELFHRQDFDCCTAIGTLSTPTDGAPHSGNGAAGNWRIGLSRETLEAYAEQAGSSDPYEAGCQLQLLMIGAIVSAGRGDDSAARHARSLAELLLDGSDDGFCERSSTRADAGPHPDA